MGANARVPRSDKHRITRPLPARTAKQANREVHNYQGSGVVRFGGPVREGGSIFTWGSCAVPQSR